MTLFPKIARPCPYIDRLDSIMDGDFCRMCKRDVYDLTAMDEAARAAFLAECGGEVCVRYTVWMKPAVAAAALAASAAVMSGVAVSAEPPVRKAVPVVLGGAIVLPHEPPAPASAPKHRKPVKARKHKAHKSQEVTPVPILTVTAGLIVPPPREQPEPKSTPPGEH